MTSSSTLGTRRSGRRGLSLIEVMVAMTLLALLAVSHTALTMRFAQRQPAVTVGAYHTAVLSGLVSSYISMPFDSLSVRTGCKTVSITATNPFAYTRCVTVSDVSSMQKRVLITLTPAALTRIDSVVIRRGKTVVPGPLG